MFYEWDVARNTIRGWFERRRLRRRFRDAPAFAIGELPESTLGRITARAQPLGSTLHAPLTDRPCVYYLVEIQELYGDIQKRGKILASEHRGVPFVLEENGHRALVEPTGATVSLVFDHETRSKAAFDADARQRALLERHELVQRNWFMTGGIAYREAVIEVGERVCVLGSGIREADPDAPPAAAYREGGQTRLRLGSTAKYPLAITDDPRWM